MIALALFIALAPPAPPAPAGACAGVVDKTAACESPARAKPPALADAKREPEKIAGIDAAKLPAELGFVSLGFAIAGGAAVAASYANTAQTDDERLVRDVERVGGLSMLVWAGLVGVSAFALALFDPASGDIRTKAFTTGTD